ncbi:PAS domain S-box-containing protein [Hasllibacter halocynthiae]|uniref:PAS domain S-box-containing protein n=1 Tax=Hasllibacter halocynthiae TaxID=595589 RepID=A0A2T0WZ39_9RHOB|nr:PAS domain-containing protein [Hasllibacter halocynthiae]PRY91915.1 PAS domain S-box-containing protein [Hasllibacter halocynthiae]
MADDIPPPIRELFAESQVALSLCDARAPDEPLLLVNGAFERLTGYAAGEVVGRNCRFLQGDVPQEKARRAIRADFLAGRDSRTLLRNHRKSGEAFDNFLYIFSVLDASDRPVWRIGSQCEIPRLGRAAAFEDHARALCEGLERVNRMAEAVRMRAIDLASLSGVGVRDLLQARLEALRLPG